MEYFVACYWPTSQEEADEAAKYDLVFVEQAYNKFHQSIADRTNMIMYYQIAHEPQTYTGIGNEYLNNPANYLLDGEASTPFVVADKELNKGKMPVLNIGPRWLRLWDWNNPLTIELHSIAVRKVLDEKGNGVFLDNATFWDLHGDVDGMRANFQAWLLDLRRDYPDKIIMGNCKESWMGMNGEMIEGGDFSRLPELTPIDGQVVPNTNAIYLKMNEADPVEMQEARDIATQYNVMIGARISGVKVAPYDFVSGNL